jgi:hypothetical protein
MVNWNDMLKGANDLAKGTLEKAAPLWEKTKSTVTAAADKTQKGAKVASLKVKIVMEENKINKAMNELGKKAYELIDRGDSNISGNSQVMEIVGLISTSKKSITAIEQEIKNPS